MKLHELYAYRASALRLGLDDVVAFWNERIESRIASIGSRP